MQITLNDLSYRYDQQTVLHNITLAIPSGSFTLLCGRTGSGKSTLLQLLSGLELPDSGTIHYSCPEPMRAISLVFQSPETQLFAQTVQKDIEYGLLRSGLKKEERVVMAGDALRKVGLDPAAYADRSPFLLSAGEKRRIAIAGALALEPQVLLLDEPTAGLDPAAAKDLLDVLIDLHSEGMTIVVSTHDLDRFFPLAEQAVVLRQGQIHYIGNVRELAANPEILKEADLELPAAVRLAHWLCKLEDLKEVPMSSDELLSALQSNPSLVISGVEKREGEPATALQTEAVKKRLPLDWDALHTSRSILERLDPRVKWLGLALISIGILKVDHVGGLLAALSFLAVLMTQADISWGKLYRFVAPFLVMFLFIWLISTVSFTNADLYIGPVGISYQGFFQGGLSITRFLLIIALGYVFMGTTSGMPLREGFEWAIRPLRRFRVPTRDISLAVSISMQFVPWILFKANQLQKALASRGEARARGWTPRKLVFMIVPLLILVIRMGDDLATAVESRGYNRKAEHVSLYPLKWSRKDTLAAVIIVAFAYLLARYG